MILLVYTSASLDTISQQLGRPEYSYRFVLREFYSVLQAIGVVIEIDDPQRQVDPIYASCREHGVPCAFLSFMPPNKTPIGLACPTIPVFAWEYDTLPDEAFGGKPRNDWIRVLTRLRAALTHSSFTVSRAQAVLGKDYPIASVPAPLWERMQTLRGGTPGSVTLPINGLLIDSLRTDLAVYKNAGSDDDPSGALPLPPDCHHYQGEVTLDGVLYTAILNPHDGRKNWAEMIKAFCIALRDKADATLLLKLTHYDPVELIPKMLRAIYTMGPVNCRVLLVHAYLKDAEYEKLLRATTYAVNASHGEGQCLPLMEYMSAGKPAIAPCHTSMLDYVTPECAFIVESSAEPGAWPHDQRQAFRTLRQRIHFQSLVRAYQQSYYVVRHEPDLYAAMGHAATASLKHYCSAAVVKPRLERFIRDRLALETERTDASHAD